MHLVRSQTAPEVDAALAVIGELRRNLDDITAQCRRVASSCEQLADAIEASHDALIDLLTQFLAITVAIQAAGIVIGLFSFGIGEAAAQIGEAAEVTNIVIRVVDVIGVLREAGQVAMIDASAGALSAARSGISRILARTPAASTARSAAGAIDTAKAAAELDDLALNAATRTATTDLTTANGVSVVGDRVLVDGVEKMTTQQWAAIRTESVHNGTANESMLGKFAGGGPESYITKAEDSGDRYFSLGTDWDTIRTRYGLDNEKMFELFNKPFLQDAVGSRAVVHFSHNPEGDFGALGDELAFLKNHGYRFNETQMLAKPKGE